MDILKGFIDIVSNPAKAIGDAVGSVANGLAEEEARRRAEEEERKKREEEERRRAEEEKRRAEEEERARRAEEVRRQQEQAEKQRQELQRQANELNNNRQNMSDEEYSMKRQELTLKDNGFNDLQSKLDAEKYGNSKVSDSLKINGEGEEGRHQFNVGKIAHKLFDGADADNLSVEQMGKRWSELGGNDQQDIASNLKTLQYRYTQEGKEQEALSTARLLGDLERYGGKAKDRDFINSLVTNAKHGGFAGDIASNIEQTLGNATGQGEKFREILNARQNDMDSLDGWNKAGNTIGNIVFDTGANLVSGGAKMALDTTVGAINVGEKALDEKTLDKNGKIRNHNLEEQAGLIGSELVTDGLRLAGAKGLTPSLDNVADLMRSGSGIKQILPEVAKYGAKELGTVLPTSYLQTNLNVMGNGGHFGEAKLEDIAKDTAMNIGTDLAMDIRSGLGRARTGGDIKQLYHDGKLLPNTGLTPNAGIKSRLETAFEKGLTGDYDNNIEHIGRLSKQDVLRANNIQDQLGRDGLNTNRDLYLRGDNIAEHAQKRFAENPDLNTPKHLSDITYNALYGNGREVLANNKDNANNVIFANKNNPSGVVPIGKHNISGENEMFSVMPINERKINGLEKGSQEAIKNRSLDESRAINNIPQNSNDVNNIKYKLAEQNKDLLATHTLTADKLKATDAMGGAIHPSIAISKPEVFVGERYGDITLVGDKDFIDPKNRQNKVKVFDNDIYSPRVPKPDYTVKNIPNEYKEMMAKTNYDPNYLLNYPKDVIGEGLDSKIYRDSYMANKAGVDNIANVPLDKYSEYLKEDIFNKPEYRDYAKKMHNMLEIEKRLLMGETSVGNAIYKPYTSENILKKMNKTELKGGERSYSSSPDYVYAAEELKNIKAIKNKQDLLQKVDIDKLNQIRDKNRKLANKIEDVLGEQGMYFYQIKEKIADYLNTGNTEGLTAKSIALLDTYKQELDSDPRLYFEAKMRRMVGLDEFKKAVIPDNLDDETRAILKNRGVETIEYKAGDNADRMAKLNALDDLKFKKTQAINEELATKQDLLARHLELTGDEKLAFNEWQNAMQKKALGYYNPETDSINLNKLSMDTLNHEIGHKMLTKVANREELLSEIKRAYGEDNLIATYGKLYGTNDLNLLAEEKLADGFTDYYNGIKNGKDIRILGQELRIPPKVLAIYDRIVEAIKGLIGRQDQIKQFYSQMETGKFRENNGLANISEQTAYKIHDTPNGKYVEIEGDPLRGVATKDIRKTIKQIIADKFQGNAYEIANTGDFANVTARSKKEIANKQDVMTWGEYSNKGRMSNNLDELMQTLKNVREVPNLKPEQKPNVAKYIYGDIDVLINGKMYSARVNIEQNHNGKNIIYDISNIKRSLTSSPSSSNGVTEELAPFDRDILLKKQGIVKNLKIADGEINDFIKDQVKKQNSQNKVPLKEKLADNVANLKHYLIDDAVAYERYTKDKALKKELREGIDRVRSSETIASQFIRDTGLSEALGKMSKKEQNEFGQYLIAKRHLEVADRDIATGRDLNIDKAIVERFKDKYSQAEEVYRNHNKAMLEHMAEHGLISSELKDKLIAENPNYAPLQRIMDEAENFSGNSKQLGNLSNQSVVKGLKGSERVVDNPLEATLNNTFRMINEVERNKVARSLAENVFGGDNVEVTRDTPNWANDKKGIVKGLRLGETEKLAYLDNGKKVEIEVPKLVAKEMKNLNGVLPDGLDKVISVLAMPAKTLRAGATGLNPIFVASNLVRDQIQSAVSGGVRSSIGGFNKAFKATFLPGKEADVLRTELARAGLGGSEYRMTYGNNKGDILRQLQAEHRWSNKTLDKLRHPIETLADIIGITENFTRAQQYFGTKGDITTKAQASRNNTLNFSRGGSVVKVLNKIIPFLNAGVQGGRQTTNLIKERPIHTISSIAIIGGIAAAAKAINSSDERRKELWDRVSDSDKKTNIIAFTPDAHYNPETNRIEGLVKIPMPQIFYPLLDTQNSKGTIPEKAMKLAGDIFTAISGIDADNPISQLTPTAVKPMLEQFTNKNFFTGRELVSDYDKNKRPDEKGAKYSSGIARGIANLTGIDAPVVDNYITGFTGSLGGDMVKTLTDNPDNTKDGKGIGDYINNGIYRRFGSAGIVSQNQIAEEKAKKAKESLNNDPTFKNMSREDQLKVLNAIDNDFSKIASTLAKKEHNREDEDKKDLNDRQKALMDGNFEAGKYSEAVQAGREGADDDNKYSKKDKKKAFYKQANAEYEDFKKEYAEKNEKGEYSRLQKIEAEHKLKRLKLTKDYDKDVRDSYGASKTNLYKLYGILSSEEKENLKGKLNGINDIMLKNGEISQKEYDSKYKIINEIESGKGGRGQKGGVGYVKGLKVEVGKLPEFKMENAPKIKGGESKLKTTGIVKGLTLNSKAKKEGQVGLKRVRVTIR